VNQGILFKEWLPDQPELGNPGLVVANNVLPDDGAYAPFYPLTPVTPGSFTLPGIPCGGFVAELQFPTSPAYIYYAATSSNIYMANASSGTFNSRSSGFSTASPINDCSFAQYGELVYAARGIDGVQVQTAGSASNFTTVPGLTGTRDARYLFVIGQFLVAANLGSATTRSATLQWSGVDATSSFPTPNSETAIAMQSGEESLNLSDGPIVGGYGGDQYGIVVQTGAITRMTYVGPPVVFQFDRIEGAKGSSRKYGSAASGNLVYMSCADGFAKTDGVSVVPIGVGKVDKTFASTAADDIGQGATTAGAMLDCAFDHVNKNMLWSFAVGATVNANKLYVYSTEEDRWSSCDQVMRTFIEPSPAIKHHGLYAFNSSNVLCRFAGTAGAATIETGEYAWNEPGRTYLDGIKANVESSGTAPSMTVRVGSRNDLNSAVSYTAATSANSATGVANFRVDAKYHRAEITITGNFDKATGLVASGKASGSR
jgi:hypothetical protein